MLKFPKGYFESEYRDGFLVESTMKRAWAAQLEVLKRIADICEKHQLKYFAYWGTLLGAVRHKGFIPWDDDIDIAMLRADYDRFLEVAAEELPQGYCVISPYTEPQWEDFFARITNSHEINCSENWLMEYHGCPFVVGVDVYPIDTIPNDEEQAHMKDLLLDVVENTIASIHTLEALEETDDPGTFASCRQMICEGLDTLEGYFDFSFNRQVQLTNQLFCLYDQICAMYGKETDDWMTFYPAYRRKKGNFKLLRSWMTNTVQMNFENGKIPVPIGYEMNLVLRFGKNYMTPMQQRAAHDYPFYKGQREILEERGLWEKVESAILQQEEAVQEESQTERKETVVIPEGWKPDQRKILFYRVSAAEYLLEGEQALGKCRRVLEIFARERDKIRLLWVEDPFILPVLQACYPAIYDAYAQLVAAYKEAGWGIYADISQIEAAVQVSAAYYGDYNSLVSAFQKAGKPVMIQNVRI